MIFLLISIVIPAAVYICLPIVIERLTGKRPARDVILIIACVVYFLSWFLPSPLIHGHNTSFTTHFIGGGVFSGLLWWYIKRHLQWSAAPVLELVSLLAFVSLFGLANEIFELIVVELKVVTTLSLTDTSWDLLANTLGALLFWLVYRLFLKVAFKNN